MPGSSHKFMFLPVSPFVPGRKSPLKKCPRSRRHTSISVKARSLPNYDGDSQHDSHENEINLASFVLNGDIAAGIRYFLLERAAQFRRFASHQQQKTPAPVPAPSPPEARRQIQRQVGQDYEDDASVSFDPVTALVLAGYAFRAYLDPPYHCHQETFKTVVQERLQEGDDGATARVSNMRRTITTTFHYPDASMLNSIASGVFLFTLDMQAAEGTDVFFAALVNASIMPHAFQKGRTNATMLRIGWHHEDTDVDGDSVVDKIDDTVRVFLYSSEQDFNDGVPASHVSVLSLRHLVEEANDTGQLAQLDNIELTFERIAADDLEKDYFQSSFIIRDNVVQSPFGSFGVPFLKMTPDRSPVTDEVVQSLRIVVQASYLPFNPSLPESADALVETVKLPDKTEDKSSADTFHMAQQSLQELVLETQSSDRFNQYLMAVRAPTTRLPNQSDWTRLSQACRIIVDTVQHVLPIQRTLDMDEDAPAHVFIKCAATDTEVWLYRDAVHDNVIVSFRGTEQVSVRDFVTDAQVFLQYWEPGQDINLDIGNDQTVGLSDMLPGMLRNARRGSTVGAGAETEAGCEETAVHFGFLQAYKSVQRALTRGMRMASEGLSADYKINFTGHSLGGALATLAAADFQARFDLPQERVCVMTYGAPKVGNVHFSRRFNTLVEHCYRVVNDADIIARLPQSSQSTSDLKSLLSQYRHSGRTVLINDDGDFWIEGIHDLSTFSSWGDGETGLHDLLSFESSSLKELLSGRSVKQHMEDSYFMAMRCALERVAERYAQS